MSANTSHKGIPSINKPIDVKTNTTNIAKNFPFSHFFKLSFSLFKISSPFFCPFFGINCTIPFLYTPGETVKKYTNEKDHINITKYANVVLKKVLTSGFAFFIVSGELLFQPIFFQ